MTITSLPKAGEFTPTNASIAEAHLRALAGGKERAMIYFDQAGNYPPIVVKTTSSFDRWTAPLKIWWIEVKALIFGRTTVNYEINQDKYTLADEFGRYSYFLAGHLSSDRLGNLTKLVDGFIQQLFATLKPEIDEEDEEFVVPQPHPFSDEAEGMRIAQRWTAPLTARLDDAVHREKEAEELRQVEEQEKARIATWEKERAAERARGEPKSEFVTPVTRDGTQMKRVDSLHDDTSWFGEASTPRTTPKSLLKMGRREQAVELERRTKTLFSSEELDDGEPASGPGAPILHFPDFEINDHYFGGEE